MSVKTLYNPASLSKPELIESFVVRTKSFEKIFSDIRSSDMKYPEKHYLIQGQRGMGKTTLLLRLKYEIENSSDLNSWLLPVFFGEESYDLTSLSRLWEKLLDFLDDALNTDGEFFNHTEAFIDFEDYEKRCFDFLVEVLQKNKKKLIIFFDNFGQLFLDNLREKEKRRLREILMHCSELRIIGASAIVLQDLHDYSEPFFEFFQIMRLEGLSKEETYQLIEKLQEKSEQKIDLKKAKGKIDTLAILTGGVIRTLMMVYQVLLEDQDGSALNDLETILDQITPLYKHRIEDLPVQQRRIVDVIAKNWDAISAKEISDRIREDGKKVQTKLISAHLAQLEKNNVIEKKQTNTKNHLYQVRERFFNIWYLMRNGDRRDRRRVKWLTKFLEMWYDDQESMEFFLERHILRLQSGAYNSKSALLIADALVDLNKVNLAKLDEMVEATSAILSEDQIQHFNYGQKKFILASKSLQKGELDRAIEIISGTKEKKNYHRVFLSYIFYLKREPQIAINEIINLFDLELSELEFLKNLCILLDQPHLFNQILERSPKIQNDEKSLALGEVYFAVGDFTNAEFFLKKAIDSGSDNAIIQLPKVYIELGRLQEAENYYLKGFRLGKIRPHEILDFYFTEFKGDISLKTKEPLSAISKNDAFFNFYHGLNLLRSKEEVEDLFPEIQSLFEKAIEDFDKAGIRSFKYQQAIANSFFFNLHFEPNKNATEALLNRLEEIPDIHISLKIYQAFGMIWLGRFQSAYELLDSTNLIEAVVKLDALSENYNDTVLLLLAKSQYHLAKNLFSKNPILKEVLKPTYFALMVLLKEDYPNEVIKMGEELIQPVNDILKRIEEMKLEYA